LLRCAYQVGPFTDGSWLHNSGCTGKIIADVTNGLLYLFKRSFIDLRRPTVGIVNLVSPFWTQTRYNPAHPHHNLCCTDCRIVVAVPRPGKLSILNVANDVGKFKKRECPPHSGWLQLSSGSSVVELHSKN